MPNSPGTFLANNWPTWSELILGIVAVGLFTFIAQWLALWQLEEERSKDINWLWFAKAMAACFLLVGLVLVTGKFLAWLLI